MICKYVHHDVEVIGKAQGFAYTFIIYLKPSFPKMMADLECRKARLNIKDNEGWIVEGSSFRTFALTQNYEIKVHQDEDNDGICFILWLRKDNFSFHLYYIILYYLIKK
jgi:hypothetical protein